jgi:hypothetical protein
MEGKVLKKSLDAVFSPQLFDPFPRVSSPAKFESKWAARRPWVLSNMAHAAYHDRDKVEKLMTGLGAKTICSYDKASAQAYLVVWPDKAILAFRGSQPYERGQAAASFGDVGAIKALFGLRISAKLAFFISNDVLADLMFRTTKFDDDPVVKVHRGFMREFNKLWASGILPDLKKHTRGLPVWVTGHSLGAAMATLAGMRHRFEDVVTFGEPRVGRNIGRAFKAKGHTRYCNGDDPVTMVPPELLFGYDHHGAIERIHDPGGATDVRYDHSIVYYSNNLARR